MKYSVIALACVLAVASAQYQYTTIRPSAYRPWVTERNEASRSVFNSPLTATLRPRFASQSSYTAKPVFSASSFPARSVFPSASAASVKPVLPAQPAPTPAASLEVSAFPARSVFPSASAASAKPILPAQPAPTPAATLEVSAFPARSVFPSASAASAKPILPAQPAPTPAATLEVSAFPARSVFPSASAASVKPELPAQPAPTPAATLGVSAFPARSVLPTPSASPATWSASAPKVSEVSILPAVRLAPVEPAVLAQASPVYPAAKLVSLPVPRYTSDARGAETLKFVNQMNSNGAYDYAYETNNGIVMQAQGSPRSFYSGEDAVAPVVSQGAFGWTSPEGKEISITYFADESGYHASGSAIPVAPEIPPQIARALEYLAKHASTK